MLILIIQEDEGPIPNVFQYFPHWPLHVCTLSFHYLFSVSITCNCHFLPFRRFVSCTSNRKVLSEKYLTCRRRWSGRIKKSGYGVRIGACHSLVLKCFPTFSVFLLHEIHFNPFNTLHLPLLNSGQALERQKEYTDAIRVERDELREEVVKLKDILKVTCLCVNVISVYSGPLSVRGPKTLVKGGRKHLSTPPTTSPRQLR